MDWKGQLDRELAGAREALSAGNSGRARTSARRAVWVVVSEYQRRFPHHAFGTDVMGQLAGLAEHPALPEEVRSAADRLRARLSSNFTPSSHDPIADAAIIIEHFERQLKP